MNLYQRVKALEKLGKILGSIGENRSWKGFDLGITENEYNTLEELTRSVRIFNGWFTEKEVKNSFKAWGNQLSSENIEKWIKSYVLDDIESSKEVGIIMAGNIPLVGFHDYVCCYIAGYRSKIKLSSDDDKLFPAILNILNHFDNTVKERSEIVIAQLKGIDGIIATGSDNTSRYFEQYFEKYPNIIRRSRTSVALITGTESEEDLQGLANDVFAFYGLGCRNVTKVFLPKGYDLDNLFKAFFPFQYVSENNKYANNYDYHKAVFMMEQYDLLENGFLIMKEDQSLHSPIGTLYYEYYNDANSIQEHLKQLDENIQCVVSQKDIPFGKAQNPELWDYADNIDTMDFLLDLK
jgi:hypothetical protein